MSLILNIETSSSICSVCLSRNGEVISIRETEQEQNHASVLTLFIEELFRKSNLIFQELETVALSAGPGSYTGLRIGASTAKGMCYALNIPLVAIDSLEALANGYLKKYSPSAETLLCPIIDARRMEVYYSLFTSSGKCISESINAIVDENFLTEFKSKPIHFFGSGAEKVSKVFNDSGNYIFKEFLPSSSFMTTLSFNYFQQKQFANLAYFEPNYIKPFYFAGGEKQS